MPRWDPVHPEFVQAIRILDAEGMPYAELWRLLRPVAARIGQPRPSYARVRRAVIVERRVKQWRKERIDRITSAMVKGLFPWP